MKTTAETEAVVKKIKSLQTVFKKELDIENNSQKPGASSDNVYKLKFW